jgi:hypothetical protein
VCPRACNQPLPFGSVSEPPGPRLLLGYRFRGRVELETGSDAWCKENPPPLHADQEEFVKVPVSRECTG